MEIRSRAYTLLELIMVIGIIAFSSILIAPQLSGFVNAWGLEIEVNKMKAKIREVQQEAISKQTTYRIQWNIGAETYTVSEFNGAVFILMETLTYQNNVKVSSTTYSVSLDSVDFDQFGSPALGGTILFQHKATGKTKPLFIQAVTGRVSTT